MDIDIPNNIPTSPNSSAENDYNGLGQKIAASTEETNQSGNKSKTMSTNIECFDEDKELGDKETQPQTRTHKIEAAELTLTEEQSNKVKRNIFLLIQWMKVR